MKTYSINSLPTSLIIGRQTETGVMDIRIDCAPWLAIWPELTLSIWVTPPGGAAAYTAATHLEGDVLVWDVNSSDTAVEGNGTMEVMGEAEGLKKLSSITTTQVLRTTTNATGEVPDPLKSWLSKVISEVSLPAGYKPYQELVVGPDGRTQWEERTHYAYTSGTVLPLTDLKLVGGYTVFTTRPEIAPLAGLSYKVTYLGYEYNCTAKAVNEDGRECVVIGNQSHLGTGLNTQEPFIFLFYPAESVTDGIYGWFSCLATDKATVPVSIVGADVLKKIDKKFLPDDIGGMPEGGAPYQQLVTDGEGNTVWADRLAYADENVETLLDLTFEGTGEDNNNTMSLSFPVETEPIEGETYTVMWNGTAYKCIAKKTVISDDAYAISLGDEGMTPFGVVIYNQLFTGGYGFISSYDNAVSVPVSILHETENIKKVDPKFLPEGIGYETEGGGEVLPETELVNMGDDGYAYAQPLGTTLVAGETYAVTYNGQRYDSTAFLLPAEVGVPGAVGLGNVETMGGTGGADMPFVLVVVPDNFVDAVGVSVMCMPLDGATAITLAIAKRGGLHRIPLKFLPEYMYGMEQSDRAEVLSERTVSATASASIDEPFTNPLVEGCEYTVFFNGTKYNSTAKLADDGTEIYIGAYKGATDDPYYVRYVLPEKAAIYGVYGYVYNGLDVEASIEVFGPGESIRKVPEKFLPASAGALTITADFDVSSVTISNLSHTYEQAKEAFVEGKEVRLLLKAVSNEKTNYYALPAIILDEDNSGTNKMLSFQLVMYALDQYVSVSYNGLTGEAEVTLG